MVLSCGALNVANFTTLRLSNLLLDIVVFVRFMIGFVVTLPLTAWATLTSHAVHNESGEYHLSL